MACRESIPWRFIINYDGDFGDLRTFPLGSHCGIVRLQVWPTNVENTTDALKRVSSVIPGSNFPGSWSSWILKRCEFGGADQPRKYRCWRASAPLRKCFQRAVDAIYTAKPMRARELAKRLTKAGWARVSSEGSHWKYSKNGRHVILVGPDNNMVSAGVTRAILKAIEEET